MFILKHNDSCELNPQLSLRNDPQESTGSPLNRLVQIRIVKDDGRTLATKLKRNIFQVSLRRSFQDLATRECASCERNLFDFGMLSNRLTDSPPYARSYVSDSKREKEG